MKKRMFGLKAKDKRNLSRYREDVIDLDDEDIDDYEDEDYPEDDYEDEDYPDDDVDDRYEEEEDYPEDEVDDRYEDDYPEDEVDDRYEDDYPEDEDYPERDYADDVRRGQYEDDYPEEADDRYEEDDYPEDEIDDRYEDDDYPEDEVDDYPEDEEDYPDEDIDDRYEDEEYPEDNYEEYPEDEDDSEYYPEDSRYDERRGRDRRDRHNKRADRDRRDRGESIPAKILNFLANTSATERIAAIFAIVILAGGIATASFYAKAIGNRQQLESFAEIGANMGEETIVGQSGLIAVADAEKARAIAAELVSEDALLEEEEEEVPDDAENVTIKMTLTSIKSDMKVKFINSQTGKLVANLPLEIDVETPDGSKVTYNDHDQDGIIYKKDITAGVYKITPKALPSGYENYKLEIKTQSLTVKDQVEMKAVDVSNEVKKESQVNAAKEDTAVKTEVESQLKDTVEWVESTKVAIGENSDGKATYEEINKDSIPDPASSSMIGIRSWMFLSLGSSADSSLPDNPGTGESNAGAGGSSGENKEEKENITINEGNITLDVDESKTLSVSGTNKDITLSTSDESIVSVDGKTITGKKAGQATITASAENCNSATITVTVKEKVIEKKKFDVDGKTINIKVGASESIGASASTSIEYTSADTSIATVSNGTVTGVKEGSTKITLKAEGYDDATVNVTVSKADSKEIKCGTSTLTVKVGESQKISVSEPSSVTYESEKPEIATVLADGTVNGVTAGTTNIKITADGYAEIKVEVNVVGNKVPMKVSKVTLVEGQSVKLASSEPNVAIKLSSSNTNVVAVSDTTITGKGAGDATITVSATGYADNTVAVNVVSKSKTLKDKNGNVVYVKNDDGSYREATYDDYYKGSKFYLKKAATEYKYTGWQTIDGKTYFFDKNGNFVTGEQVIQGAKYSFGADGVLANNAGGRGIDVSKWNGNIDWSAVKNSGINFVIIRCGYRGSSAGALIEDPTFKRNIQGAQNAGIRVGVYFFTQAVNEVEAVEEASMVINLIKGYNISYPVYLDVEASHGRGDGISAAQRTANIKAFCGTIQNAGYKAGVYANKTWFTSYINTSQITNYKIWLAQYAEAVTYSASRYDMWQYTSKGRVTGINGNVDLNICY